LRSPNSDLTPGEWHIQPPAGFRPPGVRNFGAASSSPAGRRDQIRFAYGERALVRRLGGGQGFVPSDEVAVELAGGDLWLVPPAQGEK
jgi:hypothetical protein